MEKWQRQHVLFMNVDFVPNAWIINAMKVSYWYMVSFIGWNCCLCNGLFLVLYFACSALYAAITIIALFFIIISYCFSSKAQSEGTE